MSEDLKVLIARRPLLAGALAALGLAAAGAAAYEAGAFGPHYPKTPYDDLLRLLPDRRSAQVAGEALLAQNPAFDMKKAAALREKIGNRAFAEVLATDITADDLIEVQGWVLPATLAQLSALAARAD